MSWIKNSSLWVRQVTSSQRDIFVVRKKLGNAVQRNQLKRRLRAILLLTANENRERVVIFCQPSAISAPFSVLKQQLETLLNQIERE